MSELYKRLRPPTEMQHQFGNVISFGSVASKAAHSLQDRLILNTDFDNISSLAAMLINAQTNRNVQSEKALSNKINTIAERKAMSADDLKTELSKAMHPVKAAELTEQFVELQEAKRLQEQPQQGIWNTPVMAT